MEIAKAGSLMRLSSVMKKWKACWFVLYVNGELHFWETEEAYLRHEQPHGKVLVRDEVKAIVGGHACNADPPETRTKDSLLGLKRKGGDHTVYLCAESPDDMAAWTFMLDQARSFQPENPPANAPGTSVQGVAPPPYPAGAYNPKVPAGGYAQLVQNAGQQVQYAQYAQAPYPAQYPVQQGAYPVQQAPYPVQQGGGVYTYYPPGYTYVQPGGTTVIVRDGCYRHYCDGDYMVGGMALGMASGAMLGAMMMPFWLW